MPPEETKTPETWAVLELLGHRRLAGRVTQVEFFGGKLGRIDVPQPDGSFVTVYFGAQSVYALTVTTEEAARVAALRVDAAPVQPWELPRRLPEPAPAPAPAVGPYRFDDPDNYDDDRPDDDIPLDLGGEGGTH